MVTQIRTTIGWQAVVGGGISTFHITDLADQSLVQTAVQHVIDFWTELAVGLTNDVTFQVQAGQPIPGIRWGAIIVCDRTFDSREQFDGGVLPAAAMSVTINGQAITNGAVTAPVAGTLTITADLSQFNSQIRCGSGLFASGNVSFRVESYWAQQL